MAQDPVDAGAWQYSGDLMFRQYYLGCLSQASYLVGDRGSGRAVVVDPQRDIARYLADAAAEGLRIERVLETHVHADFLSGHLELAAATGAPISYGAAADVEFPIEPLADGQVLTLGAVNLEVLHTPGHTPESICLVVRDAPGAAPWSVLTGDTLFIGDVGRPDLLGGAGWSAEELGRALYESTRRLLTLPDETRVHPAHGAGSACGKNLSTETSSTIGVQRRTNYALAPMDADAFVAVVTDGQSAPPTYFAHASHRNRELHPMLDETAPVPAIGLAEADAAVERGALLLDTRDPQDFAAAHLPGSVNVGLGGRFAEVVGQVVGPETGLVLVGDEGTATEARNRLARIGFDRVLGFLDGGVHAAPPQRLRAAGRVTADQLATLGGTVRAVDVRGPGEVAGSGLVPGAVPIPLPTLVTRLGELDPDAPTVVYCAGGYRSSTAASLLRSRGFARVDDLLGGFGAWTTGEHPVEQPAGARPAPAGG
ncbi:MBL fold metallo-hydrolase [Pseudonocardia parietis]|uniref:Glyoxylase-like metal-dependent hydrolase (Beta-lactamase superfamily II)/rhodanese-related sulfurtransferase n=1 Tax=Pseudonocardia parietis TaxID=570936 RepID=A0ABS4VKV0_9PSEU|nr:MBL fold metallo-hydrolase [Pseudonocardia parietis]MBP2364545.1 glyoxylase-like metal-dependent hydrolase (beta-lactamase superfamily II)/rhodanese-related sulfurtransferase [Pseudonocardia parietis]